MTVQEQTLKLKYFILTFRIIKMSVNSFNFLSDKKNLLQCRHSVSKWRSMNFNFNEYNKSLPASDEIMHIHNYFTLDTLLTISLV